VDYNKLAALEREMAKKFGDEVVKHPAADWDETDEREYEEQVTKLHRKFEGLFVEKSYTNKKGYLISKKLLNEEDAGGFDSCPYCGKYKFHFSVADDINLNRYGCCRDCHIQYVEDREQRWLDGWRPDINE